MIRAQGFRHYSARTAADAATVLAGEGARAMLIAGGTDVVPDIKRRQHAPAVLVSLRRSDDLKGIEANGELTIGAMTSIAEIVRSAAVGDAHRALFRAAAQVATPLIRNMATVGGNLCLDTRCNYYNQSHDWRRAIDFCKKAPGPEGTAVEFAGQSTATCWVAPGGTRCWAVSSSDLAPALIALRAEISLLSVEGERTIPLEILYDDDGMRHLTKRREEVLTSVHVPHNATRSTYWKLRRRGSFDFPVLGVAAAIRLGVGGVVEDARVVLGAVASRPLLLTESSALIGRALSDDVIEEFAESAAKHAKPLDNTDFHMTWRKAVARTFLSGVLRELRGDDPATFPLLMREAARPLHATW